MEILEAPLYLQYLEGKDNVMPYVEAELNGKVLRLVIDTGASHTCINKSIVKSLKPSKFPSIYKVMGIGGRGLFHSICKVDFLKIGELLIKDYEIVTLRLSNINKMLKLIKKKPIDGLLGCDVLINYSAIIDFENHVIRFHNFSEKDEIPE